MGARGRFQYLQQQTCTARGCVFLGNDANGNRGIYFRARRAMAPLVCLVDTTVRFGDKGRFGYFEMAQPAFDGTHVVFYGNTLSGSISGGIFSVPVPNDS